MIIFYFKSATRSIGRKKIFSGLNIAGLGIGIAIFLLTFEYFSFEMGFNQFHKNLTSLYRINMVGNDWKSASTVPNIGPMMEKKIPAVKAAIRFADNFNSGAIISYQPGTNRADRKIFREEGAVYTDKAFLEAFSFPFVEGNNQLDKPNTVVITAAVSEKLFGKETAIGKIITLNNQFGSLPCQVTGVIENIPLQSDIRFDYLFSSQILNNPGYTKGSDWAKLDNWDNNSYTSYVWLNNNGNPAAVAATALKLFIQNKPGYTKDDGIIQLQPVSELHLGSSLKDNNPTAGSRVMVYFILGLGILVLCIAWINYINFSTAFAVSQAKEIGIHKIIGSNKKQIISRYITESFLLNIIGLVLAWVMVSLSQDLFNYVTGKPLSLTYINHANTWLVAASVLSAGILICGGYVGFILARFKPITAIRFNTVGKPGGILLRKGLVVFQFVVSILFITATITAYHQLQFMKRHDLGMNINNLVVINGPSIRDSLTKGNAQSLMNELRQLPFIEKLSQTGSVPGIGFAHNYASSGITRLNPQKGDELKNYAISIIDENYFDTYQIKLVGGRPFNAGETAKAFQGDKVIINETAEKELGFAAGGALNNFVQWNNRQYQVLAVAKDYHHRSLKEKIEPIIFMAQNNNSCLTLKMSNADLGKKISQVKSLYEKAYPGNPFEYKLLKDAYDTQYADEQKAGTIALSVSVLVIMIACLGIIGLSVFTARRRIKEIGIRKVLGASVSSLFTLLSKDFLLLVALAFLIAAPLSWWAMSKWLQNFAFRTTMEWWVFAAAGLTAILIALLTVSFQAIKAALMNPVKSLRSE